MTKQNQKEDSPKSQQASSNESGPTLERRPLVLLMVLALVALGLSVLPIATSSCNFVGISNAFVCPGPGGRGGDLTLGFFKRSEVDYPHSGDALLDEQICVEWSDAERELFDSTWELGKAFAIAAPCVAGATCLVLLLLAVLNEVLTSTGIVRRHFRPLYVSVAFLVCAMLIGLTLLGLRSSVCGDLYCIWRCDSQCLFAFQYSYDQTSEETLVALCNEACLHNTCDLEDMTSFLASFGCNSPPSGYYGSCDEWKNSLLNQCRTSCFIKSGRSDDSCITCDPGEHGCELSRGTVFAIIAVPVLLGLLFCSTKMEQNTDDVVETREEKPEAAPPLAVDLERSASYASF